MAYKLMQIKRWNVPVDPLERCSDVRAFCAVKFVFAVNGGIFGKGVFKKNLLLER